MKRMALGLLPLPARKVLSRVVGRQSWLKGRYWYSMELVRDLAQKDPEEFHRFLWGNHLAYAETYEVEARFGPENVHPSRRLLFEDMITALEDLDIDPAREVRSVFEVGCSMGYLLHYLETEVFPGAGILEGIDIDEYAVRMGARHLEALGSRTRIFRVDMEDLAEHLEGRRFDVILCPGVLMYLTASKAAEVVDLLFRHTDKLLVLTGPAHPETDNRNLETSAVRERDQTLIHNLDSMVEAAGGRVLSRRWEGEAALEGNTIYFVLAEPAGAGQDPAVRGKG